MLTLPSAHALIRMDAGGINLALKYGMQNSGMGLYTILGGNWIEGPNGALLNIYTPFMMLATEAARGGYPTNPSQEDLKNAKKRYHRVIREFNHVRNPAMVKFAISIYGDSPDFARFLNARLEGVGRGRNFNLRPERAIQQQQAREVPNAIDHPYEAINSYYFKFDDLDNMDEFRLIIEDQRQNGDQPLIFRVRKDNIY